MPLRSGVYAASCLLLVSSWTCNPRTLGASRRTGSVRLKVEKGPFKGRWSVDHSGLMHRDGAVYVPKDPATIMEILRVNDDDPWQGGHFGRTRTET